MLVPSDCIFCRIVARQIPSQIVLADDVLTAFRDASPQAPTHVLVVPNRHVASLHDLGDQALAGRLLLAASEVAKQEGLERAGYRVVANHGPDAGQSVGHLHLHVLGGRVMRWPPG
jgi:histidine triad (HIT) family protein